MCTRLGIILLGTKVFIHAIVAVECSVNIWADSDVY